MLSRRVGAAVILVGGAVLVYFGFLRDWHLHWGATAQEAGGEVAGDESMPDPDIVATRAVEIDAHRFKVGQARDHADEGDLHG